MSRYAVIGAGPAGISAAWQLSKDGHEVVVVEKGPQVGGTSATFRRGECLLDYGPHAFHIKEEYITELVKELCGENFRIVPTRTNIILKGRMFHYPLEFYEVLTGLNPLFSGKMILDYLAVAIKNGFAPQPDTSFETWGIKHFGKALYELSFGKYTERVWGIPPSLLSYKLAQQKLHKLNLKDVIHKLLGGRGEEQKTYFRSYIYPRFGVGEIFEQMARQVNEQPGSKVLLDVTVTSLARSKQGVAQVCFKRKNESKTESVNCDAVISTIPLGSLASLIRPVLKENALEAATKLSYRDLILVYFIIDRDYVSQSQWVYLVDEKFRFNRFAEQKNLSPDMLPPDKTAVAFEICCDREDRLWRADDQKLFAMGLEEAGKLELFQESEVLDRFVVRIKDAYPIYDLDFERNVRLVLDELSDIPNLVSTGRNGLFLNTDIHDSMEMGMMAAKELNRGGLESAAWYRRMSDHVGKKIEG